MGSWLNPDGLYTVYGTDKALPNLGGEYRNDGQLREIEFKIDLTTLTAVSTILSDTVFVPKMRIAEVEIYTHTAAVGASTLTLSLVQTNRLTPIGALVTAHPQASMDAVGEKTVITTGGLVGTTLTQVGHVAAVGTATAFTAGLVFVKIRYYAV